MTTPDHGFGKTTGDELAFPGLLPSPLPAPIRGTLSFLGGMDKIGVFTFVSSNYVRFDSDDGKVATIIHRSALDSGGIVWTTVDGNVSNEIEGDQHLH